MPSDQNTFTLFRKKSTLNSCPKRWVHYTILVALAADWIKYGNMPHELISYEADQFKQAMVERILQLCLPEDHAILAMAHLYRRFDEQILAYILDEISTQEAGDLTKKLSRFSFVKYRPPLNGEVGSCLLHDEMRDLVNRYVWSSFDPQGMYRFSWNKKIVNYYAEKIDGEHDSIEKQYLGQERLFYWLDIDLINAFKYSRELFGQATDARDTDFMEAINTEIRRVEERLHPEMRHEFEFRQAEVLHQREHYQDAILKLTALLNDSTIDPDLLALVQLHLIVLYTNSGQLDKAIEVGRQGEQWFNEQLEKISFDNPKRKLLEKNFGELCNNLGYAYRSQYKFHPTINYYNKALKHFTHAGNAYPQIARTKNNLGFVYHRLGRDDEALSACTTALKIRENLDIPYELGLSYNVLGMIFLEQLRVDEAVNYFEKALRAFENAENERGQALALVSYGRLMRQWGWYKVTHAGEPFDNVVQNEYRQAQEMLDKAIITFRQIGDQASLSGALNERGTLFRQQQLLDDAIEYFNESVELAQQIGNQYGQVDNYQDIGISHSLSEEWDQALKYAEKASELALKIEAYSRFARAQRTVADVMFQRGDYGRAFKAARNACIFILRHDPGQLAESPAKRDLIYREMIDWVSDMLLSLPSHKLALEKSEYLVRQWDKEQVGDKRLANLYPGFITRIRDLGQDYPFLTEHQDEKVQ
ncbi:MAG: tetratricopeptide repeat protein [Candidatus Electrothrix communis]|nr:MAG: tetratricopeptide repeat protein [Candidatus Electrothrix communis]